MMDVIVNIKHRLLCWMSPKIHHLKHGVLTMHPMASTSLAMSFLGLNVTNHVKYNLGYATPILYGLDYNHL